MAPQRLILDRCGYLTTRNNRSLFRLDGLGQSQGRDVFEVLPGAMLERVEQSQAVKTGRAWFRIVGVVSRFQGQPVLFLYRAVNVYPYGNLQ
jgi:hypothetical protein